MGNKYKKTQALNCKPLYTYVKKVRHIVSLLLTIQLPLNYINRRESLANDILYNFITKLLIFLKDWQLVIHFLGKIN